MNEKEQDLLDSVQRTAVQVSDAAVDAAYGVGKKAGELLSVAKLNIRLVDLRAEVNLQLLEVGEMIYATHTGSPTESEALLAKLQEIDGPAGADRRPGAEIGQHCRRGGVPRLRQRGPGGRPVPMLPKRREAGSPAMEYTQGTVSESARAWRTGWASRSRVPPDGARARLPGEAEDPTPSPMTRCPT